MYRSVTVGFYWKYQDIFDKYVYGIKVGRFGLLIKTNIPESVLEKRKQAKLAWLESMRNASDVKNHD